MASEAKTHESHHEYHKMQILASDFEAGISVPNNLIHLTFYHSPLASTRPANLFSVPLKQPRSSFP